MSQYKIKRYPPIFRALFLDLLFDRKARPIFLSAYLMIVSGAPLYHWLVGWSWIDSFNFVVILTTISYGVFAPMTPLTKLITIFYVLNGGVRQISSDDVRQMMTILAMHGVE